LALGVLLALGTVLPARADPAADKQACVASYEAGQRLQRQRAFVEARQELLVCSRDPCPRVLQGECVGWLNEVNRAIPSVVLGARTPAGRDLTAVRVLLDGRPFAAALDGKAIDLDPGEHVFDFIPADGETVHQRAVIREGQKDRELTVMLGQSPSPPPTASSTPPVNETSPTRAEEPERARLRPLPPGAYVLAGVGVVALGSFAYFGLAGLSEQHSTLDPCKPACSPSRTDDVLYKYIVADVSLGVAIAALAMATVLVLIRPSAPATSSALRGSFAF
jgi:hypothetical protein